MTDSVPDPAIAEETARLLAAFTDLERTHAGAGGVDFETFCSEHPEHADALRKLRAETSAPAELPGGYPEASDPALDAGTILQEPATRVRPPGPPGPAPTVTAPGWRDELDATIVEADEKPGHTQARPAQREAAPEANPFGLPVIPDVSLEREIGRGGMGVVYVGKQVYLDRAVAVKVLKAEGQDFAHRFKREAKILASLSHPHIVGCYQAGALKDGQCYLVMEYIDGPNLHQFLAKNGPAPLDRALEICAHVAEALDCAHQQTIIHRDVKPANVLLQRTAHEGSFPFVAKLADLGLARPTSTDSTQFDLTVKGAVMGSPPTMAPEQFDDPQSVDYLADVYGLGCVLFHMVTGRTAYPQTTLTATITSKMREESPDPREVVPGLPTDVAAFIQSLLARDRQLRPQSYVEIASRCRELARAKPAPTKARRGGGRAPSTPATGGARARPKVALVGGLAVGTLAVAGALLWGPFLDEEPDAAPDAAPAAGSVSQPAVTGPSARAAGDGSQASGATVEPTATSAPAWAGLGPRFAVDTDHRATVKNVGSDAVDVELGDGVVGRIASDDLTWIPGQSPSEVVQLGDVVDVRVLGSDPEARRLAVGLKQRRTNPWTELSPGSEVAAVVRAVDAAGADVELANGLIARLPANELSWTETVDDATQELALHDRLQVVVTNLSAAAGTVSVSRRRSAPNPWETLAEGQQRTGTVTTVAADHATLSFPDGLVGRLDATEWSWNATPVDLATELTVGRELEVVVLELRAAEGVLSVGHRQLAEDPWRKLEIGATVRGTVRNRWSDGAAIELENGLMGEVAAREMSWTARQPDPADYVETGASVECQVLGVDRGGRRIELSLRALESDPWATVAERFPIGSEQTGTIRDFARAPAELGDRFPDGVWYAQLEGGFEGALVAVYQGAESRPSERLDVQEGAAVDLRIARVDSVGRSIEVALLLPEAEAEAEAESGAVPWQLAPALPPGGTRSLIGRDREDPLAAWRKDGHALATAHLALDEEQRVIVKGYLDRSGSEPRIEPFEASIELPAEEWQLDLAFGVSMPDNRFWESSFVALTFADGRRLVLTQERVNGAVVAARRWQDASDPEALTLIGSLEQGRAFADYMAAPAPAVSVRQERDSCRVSLRWAEDERRMVEPNARVVRLGIGVRGPRSFFDRLVLTRPE